MIDIEKAKEYLAHKITCGVYPVGSGGQCTCGLASLIAEAEAEKPANENLTDEFANIETHIEMLVSSERLEKYGANVIRGHNRPLDLRVMRILVGMNKEITQQAKEIEELQDKILTLDKNNKFGINWIYDLQNENSKLKAYLIKHFRATCIGKMDYSCSDDKYCTKCDKAKKMVDELILNKGEK